MEYLIMVFKMIYTYRFALMAVVIAIIIICLLYKMFTNIGSRKIQNVYGSKKVKNSYGLVIKIALPSILVLMILTIVILQLTLKGGFGF
jgi:hypothetical protein